MLALDDELEDTDELEELNELETLEIDDELDDVIEDEDTPVPPPLLEPPPPPQPSRKFEANKTMPISFKFFIVFLLFCSQQQSMLSRFCFSANNALCAENSCCKKLPFHIRL